MKKYFVLSVFIMLIGAFTNVQGQNTVIPNKGVLVHDYDMYEIEGIRIGWIFLLFIVVYSFILNAVMHYADRNGRDKTFWILIAIIFTPIIATFLLFLYGETKEHRKERIIEEELWKRNLCDNKLTTTP